MICDAHIHMGYFPRAGYSEPFYYSPRRIVGLMDRCGVDQFIVSSTCAQVEEISIADMIREAREMKRLAGNRAHVFCWVSGRMVNKDPGLKFLDCGAYEGIKLHEAETAWNCERPNDLERILSEAQSRRWPVQFHCGESEGMRPAELAKWAERFPTVNFDFAHCRPIRNSSTPASFVPGELDYSDQTTSYDVPRNWQSHDRHQPAATESLSLSPPNRSSDALCCRHKTSCHFVYRPLEPFCFLLSS